MKILAIQPKDVHVTLEFPVEQIRKIIDFNEKAMSLYAKVYQDEDFGVLEYVKTEYTDILKQLLKEIENDT